MQADGVTGEAKTILVVEDEMVVRMMAVDMLEDAGYDVREAATADEALELLEAGDDVDLLFTDIKMPGSIDGLGLARIVGERWPDIRILITSGHIMLPETERPVRAGFLSKPYRGHILASQIAGALS